MQYDFLVGECGCSRPYVKIQSMKVERGAEKWGDFLKHRKQIPALDPEKSKGNKSARYLASKQSAALETGERERTGLLRAGRGLSAWLAACCRQSVQ